MNVVYNWNKAIWNDYFKVEAMIILSERGIYLTFQLTTTKLLNFDKQALA